LASLAPLDVEILAQMKRFVPASHGPRRLGRDVMTEFSREY
jgi:hypothetical protein